MAKIGFIGMGNMGYAMLNGALKVFPKDELIFWIKEIGEKQRNIDWFLKEPRRAIDKSAQHMKDKAESFYGEEYELDRFQITDLEEEMERLEAEILACDTRGIIDDQ